MLNNVKNILQHIDITLVRRLNEETIKSKKILPIEDLENKVIIIAIEKNLEVEEYCRYIFNKEVEVNEVKEKIFDEVLKKVSVKDNNEIYKEIIDEAVKAKASDIHIEPNDKGAVVRYRIDGSLYIVRKLERKVHRKILSQIKVRGNMDITETRRPQDGKIPYNFNGKNLDLRLSTIPLIYGEKVVIRILYTNISNFDLDSLDLTIKQKEDLNKIIQKKSGLVIVTGPTGSGKSTTLYSILEKINNTEINITTLEDPIEVYIDGVNQINLNRKAEIDFKCALRSVLRQDPDVIMLGEIRDEETADIVVKAALTGHKVYSTIHTKTPREVFFRLEDMGVKNYLIKDSVIGIISQRLIKTLCNCKNKVFINGKQYWEENGCSACGYTGYRGRKGVFSINYTGNYFDRKDDLSNNQMLESLKYLLDNGDISLNVYNQFVRGEGLIENS